MASCGAGIQRIHGSMGSPLFLAGSVKQKRENLIFMAPQYSYLCMQAGYDMGECSGLDRTA